MSLSRSMFLDFCGEVTGYSAFDLEGTGLVDDHHQLVQAVLGPELTEALGERLRVALAYPAGSEGRRLAIAELRASGSPFGPVVTALMSLWYLGTWNQLSDAWYAAVGRPVPGAADPGRTHVPSALAYIEQLSYRTALAHTPGAKATGFGSWSKPPI